MDETAHNSLPFLKKQKWLSALHYLKYAKFPQASVGINNPVQFYLPKERSSNSAVVS